MNVLIFVMTMLMLLSIMTYARLESYRSSQAFQIVFKHYMQEDETGYLNVKAKQTYKNINVSEKNGKPSPKINASPRIGIDFLYDKTRESNSKQWEQTKVLLKNLMRTLYEKHPFFKELEQKRPAFLDELLQAITKTIDTLSPEKKPKTAADLANLKLSDPELDQLLYKMLHGAFYKNILADQRSKDLKKEEKVTEADFETSIDDDDLSTEVAEFKSPEGYYSLLDFITSSKSPIRVFLASKEVLESIFHDPGTVEAILEERENLYRQALAEGDIKALNETFKNQFQSKKDPKIDEESLNFSISKVNPKYYR